MMGYNEKLRLTDFFPQARNACSFRFVAAWHVVHRVFVVWDASVLGRFVQDKGDIPAVSHGHAAQPVTAHSSSAR